MKASAIFTVSALTLSGFAAAQLAGLSQCVINCSTQAGVTAGCTFTDPACACQSAAFQNSAALCLIANCTAEEQAAAIALQNALCAGVAGPSGVTVSIPAGSASAAVDPSLLSSVAAGVTGSGMASMASMSSMASMTAMSSAPAASVTSALVASNSAAASRVSSAAASAVSNASSRAASAASGASSLAASARPSGAANKVANVGTFVGAAGVVAGALFAL